MSHTEQSGKRARGSLSRGRGRRGRGGNTKGIPKPEHPTDCDCRQCVSHNDTTGDIASIATAAAVAAVEAHLAKQHHKTGKVPKPNKSTGDSSAHNNAEHKSTSDKVTKGKKSGQKKDKSKDKSEHESTDRQLSAYSRYQLERKVAAEQHKFKDTYKSFHFTERGEAIFNSLSVKFQPADTREYSAGKQNLYAAGFSPIHIFDAIGSQHRYQRSKEGIVIPPVHDFGLTRQHQVADGTSQFVESELTTPAIAFSEDWNQRRPWNVATFVSSARQVIFSNQWTAAQLAVNSMRLSADTTALHNSHCFPSCLLHLAAHSFPVKQTVNGKHYLGLVFLQPVDTDVFENTTINSPWRLPEQFFQHVEHIVPRSAASYQETLAKQQTDSQP